MDKLKFENTNQYIAMFDEATLQQLQNIRNIIAKNAPKATEVISYNMPAFKGKKVLVYFAAYKNHIGFYPTGKGIAHFEEVLKTTNYKYSKGAIQFPITEKLPEKLIADMVKYRVDSE